MTPIAAAEHQFHVVAWWASGRTGFARSNSAPHAIHFSAPPALGGVEERWTAEDLLLCAIASSYTTTFRTIAENAKFEYTDLQVEVDANLRDAQAGYEFGEIRISVVLTIAREQKREPALRLMQKAHDVCLVFRALAVAQKFESHVQVGKTQAEVNPILRVACD
jgi:organic hydroperoxide reductase OsmC/OhrA